MLIIVTGLVVGVFLIEQRIGFLSNAWDVVGPSKSAVIKIPVKSPKPSQIATASAMPATSSAKPKATASASLKPSASASASPR